MKNGVYKVVNEIAWSLILPVVGLAFAWIPMLCWNYGLHAVFPQVPTVTYMQMFAIQLLFMSVFSRPQYHSKE